MEREPHVGAALVTVKVNVLVQVEPAASVAVNTTVLVPAPDATKLALVVTEVVLAVVRVVVTGAVPLMEYLMDAMSAAPLASEALKLNVAVAPLAGEAGAVRGLQTWGCGGES